MSHHLRYILILIAATFLICMIVYPFFPAHCFGEPLSCNWSNLQSTLAYWQTFNASMIALISVCVTLYVTKNIEKKRRLESLRVYQREIRRDRKQKAARKLANRIMLVPVTTSMRDWLEIVAEHLKVGAEMCELNEEDILLTHADSIKHFLEYANPLEVSEISKLIVSTQVLCSRYKVKMFSDLALNLTESHARVMKLYKYAKMVDEELMPMDAEELRNSFMSLGIDDAYALKLERHISRRF